MSMTCPECGAWTTVMQTRTRKTDGVVTRRYECANLHRFSTEERIRDELLRLRLQSRAQLSSPSDQGGATLPGCPTTGDKHLASSTQAAGLLDVVGADRVDRVADAALLGLASVEKRPVAKKVKADSGSKVVNGRAVTALHLHRRPST